MCLAQGHNTVPPVGIEPRTSRFGVQCSITTPRRSDRITAERHFGGPFVLIVITTPNASNGAKKTKRYK